MLYAVPVEHALKRSGRLQPSAAGKRRTSGRRVFGSGEKLESSEVLQEIREVNLAYLLLAQRLVRENHLEAMFRLGVSKEIADILAKLTPAQLVKLAASNMVLCRFRFDDHALLSTLTHTAKSHDMQQIHAAILLARQPVESLN